jgi:hypothetical protein
MYHVTQVKDLGVQTAATVATWPAHLSGFISVFIKA